MKVRQHILYRMQREEKSNKNQEKHFLLGQNKLRSRLFSTFSKAIYSCVFSSL